MLAFRVTGISDDCYRSTMGVIGMGLGISRSAGENFQCTWERLGAPVTGLGAAGSAGDKPGRTGDKPGRTGDKPGSAGNKSRSTSNHSRVVCNPLL